MSQQFCYCNSNIQNSLRKCLHGTVGMTVVLRQLYTPEQDKTNQRFPFSHKDLVIPQGSFFMFSHLRNIFVKKYYSNTNTANYHPLKEYYAVCHYFNGKQIHSHSNTFAFSISYIWSNLKYPKLSLWGNLNSTLIPLFSCNLCCLLFSLFSLIISVMAQRFSC